MFAFILKLIVCSTFSFAVKQIPELKNESYYGSALAFWCVTELFPISYVLHTHNQNFSEDLRKYVSEQVDFDDFITLRSESPT